MHRTLKNLSGHCFARWHWKAIWDEPSTKQGAEGRQQLCEQVPRPSAPGPSPPAITRLLTGHHGMGRGTGGQTTAGDTRQRPGELGWKASRRSPAATLSE